MDCPRCNELLAAYRHAVGLYTTAERSIRGVPEDDFHVALTELRLLHEGCMDANAAVTKHWRLDHTEFSIVA
jgi:hypothetical protein